MKLILSSQTTSLKIKKFCHKTINEQLLEICNVQNRGKVFNQRMYLVQLIGSQFILAPTFLPLYYIDIQILHFDIFTSIKI